MILEVKSLNTNSHLLLDKTVHRQKVAVAAIVFWL